MSDAPDDFWLVWNPAGASPRYRHPGRQSAQAEAERLAEANPGHEFYVLHAVSVSKRPPTVQTIALHDGIPF